MAVLQKATRQELEASARRSRVQALVMDTSFMAVVYGILIILAVVTVLPYFWMVINSFKTIDNFYTDPYSLWPEKWSLEAYLNAVGIGRVTVYLRNSFAYSAVVLVAQLLINSLAAYAFARIQFKGNNIVFLAFLTTMMLPGSVTLIPTYVLVYSMGLANTFAGVVIPSFAGAFGVFLLRQFFLNIPSELEDAALIDGAGRLRIYWQIIIPLAKPAMITLGVFIVLAEWQSFIWPLVVLTDYEKYPITVGLNLFKDEQRVFWPYILAGSVIGSAPLIGIFLISQKFLIGGITLSGLKG